MKYYEIVIIGRKEMRGWLVVWLVGVKRNWCVGGLNKFFPKNQCRIDHFDWYEGGFVQDGLL